MAKVNIYAYGLTHCSICAPKDMSVEDIEADLNSQSPTGISSQWRFAKDEATFKSGQLNPCQCETDSDCKHYLMVC